MTIFSGQRGPSARRIFIALLATACTAAGAAADADTPTAAQRFNQASLRATMDSVFGPLGGTDRPGCAVGIAQGRALVATRAYGMANLEHGIALTPQSVFRVASTSKQFVAASAAILALRGKLDLDADIRNYMPELPRLEMAITARQLIHHSSGLPDVYAPLELMYGDEDGNFYPSTYTQQMIARATTTDFPPGRKFAYSNSGYLLLAQVVERVSGRRLRQFLDEEIFRPLGMRHSHFHDNHREIVPGRATGYGAIDADESRGWEIRETNFDVLGDDGLFTTLEDLAIWYAQFSDPHPLLGDAWLRLMTTPAKYAEGGADFHGLPIDYGFGNMMVVRNGRKVIGHPGGFAGFRAAPFHWVDEDVSVIALCNYRSQQPIDMVFRLGDRVLGVKPGVGADSRDRPPVQTEVTPSN
jgi:CubicO group peptidase (beta-lactamase class C family)